MRLATASLALPLIAQLDTATITGVINDPSGSPVPGVAITATNQRTGLVHKAATNDEGIYVITALPIGDYDVSVTKEGFQSLRRPNVTLNAGTRARIDLALRLGQVTESVDVTAEVPLLQSETSNLGQVIENKTITQMPLNGRNYQELAMLSAGVLPSRAQNFVEDAFSANGAGFDQNVFVLDGADNNNYFSGIVVASNQAVKPSIDAIQEFKLETHNYGAEFGRGGGAVVQVSTRSGTNQFHGTLFEFLRNEKLDANNFFNSGRAKPPYRQNQFGGTLGGPILKDRMFFFGSYEGTRIREQITRLNTVPTRAMLDGNFAGVANIADPATQTSGGARTPFAGAVIPASRFDPVAKGLLDLYPAPNRPGVQNFLFNASRDRDDDKVDARWDWRITNNDSVFTRFSYLNFDRLEPGNLPLPASGANTALRTSRAKTGVVSWTRILPGGTMVNEARVSYNRLHGTIDTPSRDQLWKQLGFQGLFDRDDIFGLPSFLMTGYSNIGDRNFAPDPRKQDVRQFVDTLSWNRGRHAMKAGVNIRQFIRWTGITNFARGRFNFNGQFTRAGAGTGALGDAIADSLLGLTNTVRFSNALSARRIGYAHEFFVQDDWKVSSRLTLNLGLRYEYQSPYIEQNNRRANFVMDPASPNFGRLVQVSGDGVEARSFRKRDLNNFAPRIGFAYRMGDDTVIRGGYGIFYAGDFLLSTASAPDSNPPFYLQTDIPTQAAASTSNVIIRDGISPSALDPTVLNGRSLAAVWPFDFPIAITNQWNFNIQRNLPGNSLVSAAYVGSNTVRGLLGAVDINQPAPGAGGNNPRRAFPQFANITAAIPLGGANYQALEAKFERRFSGGFSILSGYTFSKTLTKISPQRSTTLAPEKAISLQHMPHRFFTAAVWDLPFGRGRSYVVDGAASHILGGWQLSPIFEVNAGLPFSPSVAGNPANTTGGQRPDRSGDGNLPRSQRTPERWFDASAFAVPARYTFGNSAANVLTGPGAVNMDLMVSRTFRFTERLSLDFRAEFFNLFNEAHFLFPNAVINNRNVGLISQTADSARQIQFGMKLIF
ncbi:MAG: TonB-dependent receptor [Bryobacteraceae bacterium]